MPPPRREMAPHPDRGGRASGRLYAGRSAGRPQCTTWQVLAQGLTTIRVSPWQDGQSNHPTPERVQGQAPPARPTKRPAPNARGPRRRDGARRCRSIVCSRATGVARTCSPTPQLPRRRGRAGQGARGGAARPGSPPPHEAGRFRRLDPGEVDTVERALERWVPADAPAGLGEAMRYAVLDGGKRVRPLLVLAAAQAVQGPRRGCAARRVRRRADPRLLAGPRRHAVHGQRRAAAGQGHRARALRSGQAMLAGDAMQAGAGSRSRDAGDPACLALQARLCALMARAAGHAGMAGGQAIDLASIGRPLDEGAARHAPPQDRRAAAGQRPDGCGLRRAGRDGVAGADRLRRCDRPGVSGGRRHPGRDPGPETLGKTAGKGTPTTTSRPTSRCSAGRRAPPCCRTARRRSRRPRARSCPRPPG